MEQDTNSQVNIAANGIKGNEKPSDTGNTDINRIMEKVRANIAKRRAEGAYTYDDEILINLSMNKQAKPELGEFDKYLQEMRNNWDVENKNYIISSHRKIIGPVLIKGRNLVNGEVRRYIDPSLLNQSRFNLNATKIIEYMQGGMADIQNMMLASESHIDTKINDIDSDINSRVDIVQSHVDNLQSNTNDLQSLVKNLQSNTNDLQSNANSLQLQINEIKSSLLTINKHLEDVEGSDWSKIYNREVSEKDLEFNIDYHKEFISMIAEYAKKNSSSGVPRLLEVGLGSSTITIHFSKYAYFCVGLDNNPIIIKRAMETNKKLGGYAKFILLDAFDLSMLKDNSFDVAFSQGTMEHFDNPKIVELLSNQLKVAKYVIFSVPSVYYQYKEFGNERKMTIEDWRSILGGAEFNIVYLDYYRNKEQIACIITGR